jgi:hypothetical protein
LNGHSLVLDAGLVNAISTLDNARALSNCLGYLTHLDLALESSAVGDDQAWCGDIANKLGTGLKRQTVGGSHVPHDDAGDDHIVCFDGGEDDAVNLHKKSLCEVDCAFDPAVDTKVLLTIDTAANGDLRPDKGLSYVVA